MNRSRVPRPACPDAAPLAGDRSPSSRLAQRNAVKPNSLDLESIRHVIWDWNGTLLDDAWLCIEVMNGLLVHRGMPALDAARYREIFGFPVRNYYRRLGFDFAVHPFEEVGTEFVLGYHRRERECRLQPGAASVLQRLSEWGIAMSVLSASRQDHLEAQVERLGVRSFFVGLLGLDDHYAGSKLENGHRWMRRFELAPREVLLIGDTIHDYEVARAIGAACLLVPSGHQSEARLRRLHVPILASMDQISAWSPARR